MVAARRSPAPAARPQLHISASAIRTLECPREFLFRYIQGVPREDLPSSMVLGTAVHRALQLFYVALRDGTPERDLDALLRAAALSISKAVVGDVPIAFADGESPTDLIDEAARLLEVFIANPYRPAKVLGVEQRFALVPAHPVTGEVLDYEEVVVGVFDLVCLDDDCNVRIVDHKCSKRLAPPKYSNMDVQMSLYAWAGDQLYDAPVQLFHQTLLRTKSARVELNKMPRDRGDSIEAIESVLAALELVRLAVVHPEPMRLLGRQRSWKCASCGYRARCGTSA